MITFSTSILGIYFSLSLVIEAADVLREINIVFLAFLSEKVIANLAGNEGLIISINNKKDYLSRGETEGRCTNSSSERNP